MGIDVWGVIDKNGRLEQGLWAVPNARDPNLPPALWLRVVKKRKGTFFCHHIFVGFLPIDDLTRHVGDLIVRYGW
jgi:hypothetical protein